ncbi:hypothetical protein Tco_0118139 [Tanacetum coccineum]
MKMRKIIIIEGYYENIKSLKMRRRNRFLKYGSRKAKNEKILLNRTEDLDTYDSDCDDLSNAQAVLMANISNYGSDVISEVPHFETYLNDIENQSVHAM